MKQPLIIISGPTATGKTITSISLAKKITSQLGKNAIIINFDSLLFYKELNIGTAKPTNEEQQGIPHELIDIASIENPLNAADYVDKTASIISKVHTQKNIPILVGGSGFYLRALIKGMYSSPSVGQATKNKLNKIYAEQGIQYFIDFLKENDQESYSTLHKNDHYRIIRAVEHFEETGEKFSKEKNKANLSGPYDFSISQYENWDIHHIFLDLPKDEHFQIIQARAKKMATDGLLEEVVGLLASGFTGQEKPLQSIGYKETIAFINKEFKSEKEYLERITISTRQLAKAQRTFFKKVTPKYSYNPLSDSSKIISEALNFCSKFSSI